MILIVVDDCWSVVDNLSLTVVSRHGGGTINERFNNDKGKLWCGKVFTILLLKCKFFYYIN